MDSDINKNKNIPPLHEFYGEAHQIMRIFNWLIAAVLMGLAIGVVYELSVKNIFAARLLGVAVLPVLASLYFIRLRKIEWVAAFLTVVVLSLVTVVATSGRGIRQVGVIAYPAILVVASLVTRERVLMFLTLYSIACVAWLVFGEIWGVYAPQVPSNVTPGEFWMVTVVLIFTAFMARLLTGALFQNNLRLQGELRERELVEEQRKTLIKELEAKNAESEILREGAAAVALSLDFDETVAHILDQLQQVVPYDSASVQLLIGDELEIIGGRGFPDAKDAIGMRFVLNETDPAYPILRDGLPYVLYPDIQSTNERFKGFLHDHILSWMAIPLYARGRLIGMFALDGFTVNKFTEVHARFALTFANQVAVTLENSRLYAELQAELRKQIALRNAMTAITSSLRLNEVLMEVCRQMASVVDATSAYIANYDQSHSSYTVVADFLSLNVNDLEQVSDLGTTYYKKDGVWMFDRDDKMEFAIIHADDPNLTPSARNNLTSFGGRSVLYIPLRIQGRVIGHTELWEGRRKRIFTSDEVSFCQVISQQAAIAIENANLFEESQRDLAIRQGLVSELESKNAELERFTYTVSHDLKSPLFTIRGFLGYLEQDALAGNHRRMQSDMQRITDATEKMQQLLNDLLELSRIGRLMNAPTRIPFEELVREAVELVHGRIMEIGAAVHIDATLPAVFGDRPRLIEVVQNLVDNAAKFMGNQTNPRIEIGSAGEEDGKSILFVRDNGIGIPREHHERIFGLFNKLDVKADGTGIGLALVKRIIEFHGGRIWVESEAGMGSTFYFTLPSKPPA